MADITGYNQGEVNDSGKVNWRGDQVTVTQGNQSHLQSSTVPLAELGSRLVVGDRIFRYARADGAVAAGDLQKAGAAIAGETSVVQTTAGAQIVGAKTWNYYTATALSANDLAEGTLLVCSGTNPGYQYRIKSHPAIGTTSTGTLTLYDSIAIAANSADQVSVMRNLYADLHV